MIYKWLLVTTYVLTVLFMLFPIIVLEFLSKGNLSLIEEFFMIGISLIPCGFFYMCVISIENKINSLSIEPKKKQIKKIISSEWFPDYIDNISNFRKLDQILEAIEPNEKEFKKLLDQQMENTEQ